MSCGDVGVILRGRITDEDHAGPAKEAAIARACLHDGWAPEVLECIGTSHGPTDPTSCLDRLGPEQRASFHKKLAVWNDEFPDEDMPDGDDDADADVDFVECSHGIGNVGTYAPPITRIGEDRDLEVALRSRAVLALCDDWSTEARRCFGSGGPPATCRTLLEPDQARALADKLTELEKLMTKVAAAKAKPGRIHCTQVVAAHYGDKAWQGKLDALKPAQKRQLVTQSRARMTKACTADKWPANLRACVIAAGPTADTACFVASGVRPALWGYPASGIAVKTGIPECDAYGEALAALSACPAVPSAATVSLLEAYHASAAALAATPPADRPVKAAECKRSDAAIRQSASALGCTI
ncbi:MAG: hypothetical protein H0T89_32320 [Deltaproteobacteria bacterium]|nr:hypothetical protein [Deltaproteobacteria bacterium]